MINKGRDAATEAVDAVSAATTATQSDLTLEPVLATSYQTLWSTLDKEKIGLPPNYH